MNEMPQSVDVARGITMPFFPMRPGSGQPLKTKTQVESLIEALDSEQWLYQPKLNGHRACLGVVDGHIFIQNRHGRWFKKPVTNAQDFLKLPDRTCFDGEVVGGEFFPFECLAIKGQSLIFRPASERATVAFQEVKFLKHRWLFAQPSPKFLRATRQNLPNWEGVLLKGYMSHYIALSKATQISPTWLKRKW